MGDVVAYTSNFMDQSFNVAQHPVNAGGKLIERVIAPVGREALTQITGDNTLDSAVDFRKPCASTHFS